MALAQIRPINHTVSYTLTMIITIIIKIEKTCVAMCETRNLYRMLVIFLGWS